MYNPDNKFKVVPLFSLDSFLFRAKTSLKALFVCFFILKQQQNKGTVTGIDKADQYSMSKKIT